MIGRKDEESSGRIVVGIDGSAGSSAALSWALEEAQARDAQVTVVHAWQPAIGAAETMSVVDLGVVVGVVEDNARAVLDEALDRAGTDRAAGRLVCAAAGAALLEAAEDADLLVVGARNHHGIVGAILGSVADYVARHATVPVVVVPPPRPGSG